MSYNFPFSNESSPWAPARSGSYARDCETGRDYARQFIAAGNPTALPFIVAAMPRGADLGGVEIGFLTGISCVARLD